ncbi:DUF2203 domain-containing protein [Fontivita pretiosa]|uniref:DUF2203 domain-containing protein n=1 Tax=Fontivita pretiosa TaxID=2989684 RepID=UPI003D1808EB
MAGPQSFIPPRLSRSRPRRRFTLEQANRTLPLVSRIVADIVKAHKQATTIQIQLERLSPASRQRRPLEQELERAMERLNDLVSELSAVGCEVKDFQLGLVDFIGRHQGRDVYLCWKLGEPQIDHWHELDAGFAGRQPVSLLQESQ